MTAIKDRFGNQLSITRNAQFAITKITSPHGRSLSFTYGTNGFISKIQDNLSRSVSYGYDANNHLQTVTDANNGITTYSYTYNSNLANYALYQIKDPRGNYPIQNVQYDACGRVSQETQADGTTTWNFSYYPGYPLCFPVTATVITDPNNNVTDLYFDSGGYLTKSVEAMGKNEQQTTTVSRSSNELITDTVDQLNRDTHFTYDGLGNLLSVTRLYGTSNVKTSYTYEPTYQQLATVTDPLNHTWTIGYDGNHNPSSITDPNGHASALDVDPSTGLLSWVKDAVGDQTSFSYSGSGDLHQITDPLGNITYRNTDSVGRVTSIEDPLRNITSFAYDNLDHLTSITDAAKPTGGVTRFGYDANENLTSVIDAQWTTYKTQYGYDAMNRRSSRTDALGKSESYQYDGNSNLTKYTDRNGSYVNYTYDGINRRAVANFQGGTDVINYGWDGGDRLTSASDSVAGTITRTPDLLDRLTKEVTPQGTVSYTYDNADRRQIMTVAGQNAVNYTFDAANRLTQLSQSGTGTVSFGYDNADRRMQLTLPDSVVQTYGYDVDSHVTSIGYKHGSTNLGNLTYGYDMNGRRTAVGGSMATVSSPVASGGTNTFNADNEMTRYFDPQAPTGTTLGYDANGQLTSDGGDTYTWDVRRHLSAISGLDSASFVYDALGRRIKKTINGTTTQFLYDGLNAVQELSSSNAVVATMLTGLNIDEYFQRTEPACCGPLSYLTDALGSTAALADSSGTIQNTYYYEPFGGVFAVVLSYLSSNSYTFTGREVDGTGIAGGTYYYRARYYNSALQRFISQDPIDFAGGDTNLYAYAANSPTNLTDPDGRGVIGAIVGGASGAAVGVYTGYLTGGKAGAIAGLIAGALLGGAIGAIDPGEGILTLRSAALIGAVTGGFGDIAGQFFTVPDPLDLHQYNIPEIIGSTVGGSVVGALAELAGEYALLNGVSISSVAIDQALINGTLGEVGPLLGNAFGQFQSNNSLDTRKGCRKQTN